MNNFPKWLIIALMTATVLFGVYLHYSLSKKVCPSNYQQIEGGICELVK